MKMNWSDWVAQANLEAPSFADVPPAVIERIQERTMKQITAKKTKRRKIRVLLTVAAALAALSLTAGAVYVATRAGTRELIAAGPLTGGSLPQEISETSAAVIDETQRDMGLQSTSGGTTVTLESTMGFATGQLSVMYLTMNVACPEGTDFGCDVDCLGFVNQHMEFEPELRSSGSGSTVVLANEDGTYSVMLMYEVEGDLSGSTVTLELSDFTGMGDDETMIQLFNGTLEPTIVGDWSFTFDPGLDVPDAVEFDPALFDGVSFLPESIALCELGGAVTCVDDSVLLQEVAVEFADGTIYEGQFRSFGESNDLTGECHFTCGFVFEAPQDLTNAAALIIDGVRVPLP